MSDQPYFAVNLTYRRFACRKHRWKGTVNARDIVGIINIDNHHIYGATINDVVRQAEHFIDTLENALGTNNE